MSAAAGPAMYESDDEYSFVVLSRVNSFKKVRFWLSRRRERENPNAVWKFIGRRHESVLLHKTLI